jgi:hypothetical protein
MSCAVRHPRGSAGNGEVAPGAGRRMGRLAIPTVYLTMVKTFD